MAGVQEILNQAMALGEEERWEEMAELLAGSLDDSPDEPYFLCWLGVAEQELGNDGMAYEYFRRCIAQEPLDPHLLALAGSGLAVFDDPEAEAVLRAAALSAPELPVARLQYGAYLARRGLFDEAREHLRAAAELAPDDPAVHSEFACALALEDQFENATAEMERALELAPEDAWSRLLVGLFYTELGQLEDGAEQLIGGRGARGRHGSPHTRRARRGRRRLGGGRACLHYPRRLCGRRERRCNGFRSRRTYPLGFRRRRGHAPRDDRPLRAP